MGGSEHTTLLTYDTQQKQIVQQHHHPQHHNHHEQHHHHHAATQLTWQQPPSQKRNHLKSMQHYERLRQKRFAAQRSILKNSHDIDLQRSYDEERELLEAKTQLILRRRRLFSHYRQYEEWRRRQFSYEPCCHLITSPSSQTPLYTDYYQNNPSNSLTNPVTLRPRQQYHRQYSYNERLSQEDDSPPGSKESLCYLPKCYSRAVSTDSTLIQANLNSTANDSLSFDSECGALAAYQPLHCSNHHLHVFQEENSAASISERITRSRINSAIFVSSEGRGFDSIEFLRRHGSQSVLCRKAKSAENIMENNGRKKSLSEKRQWHTSEGGGGEVTESDEQIELHECTKSIENHPVAALKTNIEKLLAATSGLGHSAAVTTSNGIVGSISIETPPPHIRDMERKQQEQEQCNHTIAAATTTTTVTNTTTPATTTTTMPVINLTSTSTNKITSDNSSDTCEELVVIDNNCNSNGNNYIKYPRSRKLVHQRSSTGSPALSSVQGSPKTMKLKYVTPKINNLPMVSISGPSPPDDRPTTECL